MQQQQQVKKTPADFLKLVLGCSVIVKLNSGVTYQGAYLIFVYFALHTLTMFILLCPFIVVHMSKISYNGTGVLVALDGYMNIAMEQTEEWSNGQLKGKYGDAFIRGNNVLYISTQTKKTKA